MSVLVLGSTGLLGQALMKEASRRGIKAHGVARTNAEFCLDISDVNRLEKIIKENKPEIIINTVAKASLDECEKYPDEAYITNARPAAILADLCSSCGFYFIQISTDHYYTGDGSAKHGEHCPLRFVNEYARTKYVAEIFALQCPNSLVVRTNIVGFRNKAGQPTFLEWVLASLLSNSHMILFEDFYTSSIDVGHFSEALFDLLPQRRSGILNLASSEVANKRQFIERLAFRLGLSLENTQNGSVRSLKSVARAESLGLDVKKAEAFLGYRLPTLDHVIDRLASEYKGGN